MKTKAKATEVFELRLWSSKHFGKKIDKDSNIFQGMIINSKTKETVWIKNSGELLVFIEKQYRKANKK